MGAARRTTTLDPSCSGHYSSSLLSVLAALLISALTVQSKLGLTVTEYKFLRLEDSLKLQALRGFTAFAVLITRVARLECEDAGYVSQPSRLDCSRLL